MENDFDIPVKQDELLSIFNLLINPSWMGRGHLKSINASIGKD